MIKHLWKPRLGCNFPVAIPLLILLTVLNAGCSVLGRPAVPTPIPEDFIETAINLPAEADELSTSAAILNPSTPEATETQIPQNPSPAPNTPESTPNQSEGGMDLTPQPTQTATLPPAITPNPPQGNVPEGHIQITSPGPMSKISSSLEVNGTLRTVPNGHFRIELWLEPLTPEGEPRLMLRELQNFFSDPMPFIYISKEFNIAISRPSEFAQLRVSTYDADSRLVALASVDLLLLSVGSEEINPPGDLHEQIVLIEPRENELIQGGIAFVSGMVRSFNEHYLTFSLTTADGNVIGVQQLHVTSSPEGDYVPFSIEVPYYISATTQVRLSVYENTSRIAGITHLSSILVLVSP